jgi:L-ascorbate metabolism protein UlaG (beta-lactamase superfamily)
MNSVRHLAAALIAAAIALVALAPLAEAATSSRCIAMAQGLPGVTYAAWRPAALNDGEVRITFVGHGTFRIESSGGVTIATDYAGSAGRGPVPDIVTMNHAHSTHYTDFPDPGIKHVLRGWNPAGGPARHDLTVGDVYVRNVPTDIRRWGSAVREKDGNSIFIFEIAGMCIGHLGHLHHTLGSEYLALIGQLDIVMVPVDGSYTMDQAAMLEVLKLLKARLVLPMHYFGPTTLSAFLSQLDEAFPAEISSSSTITVSAATLPAQPKIVVLPDGGYFSLE